MRFLTSILETLLGILLFLYPLTPSALAHECAPLRLAHRTGQESCWVNFYLNDHRTLCVDHANWIKWLLSPSPGRICLEPSATRWKAYSPPINHSSPVGSSQSEKFTTFKKNIKIQSQISPWNTPHSLEAIRILVIQRIESIRERTSSKIAQADNFGILRSLLLNEKTSQSPVSLLRKVGFVHLASATGIHLYALARGWDGLLRIGFFSLRLPTGLGIVCSRFLSFSLCFCVWMLSGARVGMLRPWIVLSLREVATFLGFRWRRTSPLLLALLLDFGVASYWACVEKENFGETFGASGRIIYALAVGGGLIWCKSFKSVHVGLAIGSWLLVAIWEGWHSGSMALLTPLLSLISLPLVCYFIFPLMVTSIFIGELGFTRLNETICQHLSWGLSILTEGLARFAFHFGNLWVVGQSAILWACFLSSLVCVLQFFRPWKGSYFFILSGLFTLRCLLESHPSSFQIEQLDVGQGDAALIRANQTGMIDSGSGHSITDVGWMELFATRRTTRLNWAAISHLDEDHSGGFLRLARLLEIDCIATPQSQLTSKRGEKYQNALFDYSLKIAGWNSGCIPYPAYATGNTSITGKSSKRANANMGAIWIPLKSGGFYLTAGDADQRDEILIANWAAPLLKKSSPSLHNQKRILKISHHGSKTSSAPEFLRLINANEVWISAGRGNRYGHPTSLVLERLQNLPVRIRRTDLEGVLAAY